MNNQELDIKSPYIKSNVESIDEIRKRLIKRTGDYSESEVINLSFSKEKESSDDLLKQKIQKISKKIVGEEIKKFGELASLEITKEFESLEKKFLTIEEKIYDEMLLHSESIHAMNKESEEELKKSVENIGLEIDEKINKLNLTITEIESRLKDLEIFSLDMNKNISKNNFLNTEEVEEDIESKEYIEKNNNLEEDILNEKIAILENIKEEDRENDEIGEVKAKNYVDEKIREVIKKFERDGLFFKKDIFSSRYAKLNAEHFLNKKDDYTDLNELENEKMYFTIINLMDKTNLDPREDENILEFLKRMYFKRFEDKISR